MTDQHTPATAAKLADDIAALIAEHRPGPCERYVSHLSLAEAALRWALRTMEEADAVVACKDTWPSLPTIQERENYVINEMMARERHFERARQSERGSSDK